MAVGNSNRLPARALWPHRVFALICAIEGIDGIHGNVSMEEEMSAFLGGCISSSQTVGDLPIVRGCHAS